MYSRLLYRLSQAEQGKNTTVTYRMSTGDYASMAQMPLSAAAPERARSRMAISRPGHHSARMNREAHWNRIYETKPTTAVSWYQRSPDVSRALILKHAPPPCRVIDVGGGASTLVDVLLDEGYTLPVVLDVSKSALERTRERLASRAELVEWVVADVTSMPAPEEVDLWHDRAVLHFLTDVGDQAAYAELACRTIRKGGHAVIGTFAQDGPERCSGLPVRRHDAASVLRLLGGAFELVEESREIHMTPTGAEQRFQWTVARRC